ncbi:ABC transporter permease [Raoultibacter phocaeensis]|uniref:ABC transporter permease n=1 Tax=Raoultibacter phocaeensis TaxID=2479841 RepID=UPI00210480F4|nr:ABC transporter permease [Raoultibacter phocaeensis]
MSFPRALRSEFVRLVRSPLVFAHLACALAGGLACGAYFAVAPWDASMGADAYVQLLGAMMPLMAGIVCGLAVDEERRAGGLANLTAVPSRRIAIAAKGTALWLMGFLALAFAVALFAVILAAAGKLALGAGTLVLSVAGLAFGSAPLYALMTALALRFGRNVSIGVGAAGLVLAFFSVGGLAHGLMTGELTAVGSGLLGLEPFALPTRLGSLAIEGALASAQGQIEVVSQVGDAAMVAGSLCSVVLVAALAGLFVWFEKFEEGRSYA